MGAATSKATPALIRAIGDPEKRVSDDAFRALRGLNRIIDIVRAELQAMLESRLPHVRANAVRCLPFARTDPPSSWESFLRALDDRKRRCSQPPPRHCATGFETCRPRCSRASVAWPGPVQRPPSG
jgi:hypothetical protein